MRRLATFLILCPIVPVAAGSSISSEFSAPALVFKLTVANPDTVMRHVTKVGVRSRAHGNFGCLTESAALLSLADYPISFSVTREETLTDADPKIVLPPGSSAAFTVSLYPHATGACGAWSSDVSAIVVFDDGTRLETQAASIGERDLEVLRTRNPQRDEVLQGLNHRNVDLRLQSLRQLGKVGLDRVTLEDKVRLALQDPEPRVRSEAYRQVAPLNLQTLTPDLIKRFALIPLSAQPAQTRQANSAELLELCRSFTMLRAAGAEDSLLAVLTDPNFLYPEALGEALQKIRTPAMPSKLMQVLASHRAWASALSDDVSAEGPKLATRYDILLKTLIDYRDVGSVSLLRSLLSPPQNRRTARVILTNVLALTDATHRVQDPFVLAFRDVARRFTNDPWGDDRENLREPAMLLSVRASDDRAEQIPLLRAGLRDRSPHVQLAAAREAAALTLTSMAPEILKSYRNSNESLRPYFCNALTALDAKCHEQGESQ
jgi:HEAT repeat protein